MSDYEIARRRVEFFLSNAGRLLAGSSWRAQLEDMVIAAIGEARAAMTNTAYERGRADELAAREIDEYLATEPEGNPPRRPNGLRPVGKRWDDDSPVSVAEPSRPPSFTVNGEGGYRNSDGPVSVAELMATQEGMGQS